MRDLSCKVLLLSLLLLSINLCITKRVERTNQLDQHDGGDVERPVITQVDKQETSIKHENEDGHDVDDPQKDGHSARSEPEHIDMSAPSLE